MKNNTRITLSVLLAFCAIQFSAKAQITTTFNFDELTLDSGKVINGSDGYKLYQMSANSITLNMPVYYDTQYKYWSGGWAFSRVYDSTTTTSNFSKQLYASKGFKGYNNSPVFAVGTNGSVVDFDINTNIKDMVKGFDFYIASSTYTYNSITFGDAFGKKFGGATGTDPDFFKLKISAYSDGNLLDTFSYYLADFTGSTDFKNSGWTHVQCISKGDSFVFGLTSSDNGSFGMNTPAFYTIDNISYSLTLNTKNSKTDNVLKLWPNPAKNYCIINSESEILSYTMNTLSGQSIEVPAEKLNRQIYINTTGLKPGIYIINVNTASGVSSAKMVVSH